MYKGLLRVTGTLDLSQFWPLGESDADTMRVKVSNASFAFAKDRKKPQFTPTKVFKNAWVKGQQDFTSAITKKGEIKVRLQGIDAPELHMSAGIRKKGLKQNGTRFRQFFGETATVELSEFLKRAGGPTIRCEVRSVVDHPNQVFDTYGRFIGDVYVAINGKQNNVNHWLVEHGWAMPVFYNSMWPEEMRAIRQRAMKAAKGSPKRGLWSQYHTALGDFDPALVYRNNGPIDTAADRGPVVWPKLFRRQVKYYVSTINSLFTGSYKDYLKQSGDPWITLDNFVKNPKQKKPKKNSPNGTLASTVSSHNTFTKTLHNLVFFEEPSTLVKADKKTPITKWGG